VEVQRPFNPKSSRVVNALRINGVVVEDEYLRGLEGDPVLPE
jgi:hypothetical protein